MKVRHLFNNKGFDLYFVAPEQPLTDAVAVMMRHRVGSLAVLENEDLVSIVTERDVMQAVHSRLDDLTAITVREVMAPRLIWCNADDSIDDAMELMFHNELGKRVRHLPVMDGDRLMGIISIGDIVQALLTEVRFENRLLRNYIKNWPEAGI
ncbi:MAG: CBS domain-containing protein [Thiohalomonadaceae bacterium]